MSNFLILPGRYLNILNERTIESSDPESGYDASNVADNEPSHSFKFDDPGTDDYIRADLTRTLNGGMEDWAVSTVPDDWDDESNGTGVLAKESTIKQAGSFSCKCDGAGSGNEAIVGQKIWVVSGWDMTVDAYIRGDGSNAISAYLRNLYTGNYLDIGGNWVSSAAFGTQTATSFSQKSVNFTVESYSTCGYRHLIPLHIYFSTQGDGYVDVVNIWPHWDFISFHGHNIPPNITVKVQSDDGWSFPSPTTQATMSVVRPAFYKKLASKVTERYVRSLLEGTVTQEGAVYIGEWVLGQYKTLSRQIRMRPNPKFGLYRPQIRSKDYASHISARATSSDMQRESFDFVYTAKTSAQHEEILEILERCRNGVDPVVIVPSDSESMVIFGYLEPMTEYTRIPTPDWSTYNYIFNALESPLPLDI